MKKFSKELTIIAYYFSEYNKDAVSKLGYNNQSQAFEDISKYYNRENNYLKLRRDEFDVLTSSPRKGWRNRNPAKDILETYKLLKNYSFEEMTELVIQLLNSGIDLDAQLIKDEDLDETKKIELSEAEIEHIINFKDINAGYLSSKKKKFYRKYNHKAINNLKKLYQYKCQLCAKTITGFENIDIVEAHHIIPFSQTLNNDMNNVLIVCPNHHRLIHKLNGTVDLVGKKVIYSNNKEEKIIRNYHLI